YLGGVTRTTERVRAVLREVRGGEIGKLGKFPESARQHWKALLSNTLYDLSEHQQDMLGVFWAEGPLMPHNIATAEGEAVALEPLDSLRAVRQSYPNFRMVFTGSIGLHNVLSLLRRAGYANDPTNDMAAITVPPLAPPDAAELALQLLTGIGAAGPGVQE